MPLPTPSGRQGSTVEKSATDGDGATEGEGATAGDGVTGRKGATAEAAVSEGPVFIAGDSTNQLNDTSIPLPMPPPPCPSSTFPSTLSRKRKSNVEATSPRKKIRSSSCTSTCPTSDPVALETGEAVTDRRKHSTNHSRKRESNEETISPRKKFRSSTPTSTCPASALVALETEEAVTHRRKSPGAVQGTPAADEHRQKHLMTLRVQEAKNRANTARVCLLGEELYRAVADKGIQEVRRLLDGGADVNYVNRYGSTPLQRALFGPREDVVQLLLERGADANAVNEIGISAMHLAAGNNLSGRCVDQLLRAGGAVNARSEAGVTPLHTAADWNNVVAVRALLSAGAKKDLKAWDGPWKNRTPVELTTSSEIRELLRL